MSKHNVHPDHYKTAGRERQGKALGQDISRKALIEQQARVADYAARRWDEAHRAQVRHG